MTLAAGSSPCAPHSDCSRWLAPLTGLQCSPTHCPLPAGSNHDQQEVIINFCCCSFTQLQPTGCVHVHTLHPTPPRCPVCVCAHIPPYPTSLSCGTSSKRAAVACPAAIFTASDLLSIRARKTGVSLSGHRGSKRRGQGKPVSERATAYPSSSFNTHWVLLQ